MLWLDMGLGKTVITLTSVAHLVKTGFLRGVIIVAPIRVIRLVWRQEAAKWNHTSGLKFSLVTGTKDQRTRALLRRSRQFQPAAPAQLAKALQIDEQGQRALIHSRALDLTRREYQLLQSLVNAAGRILSRDALLEQIWGLDSESTDRTVDTHIKTLRAKLRERLPDQELIVTHRGLGYSLNQPG
jgi:hypothetical protein